MSELQLQLLKPEQLAPLKPDQLAALKSDQLASLKAEQLAALKPAQLAALDDELWEHQVVSSQEGQVVRHRTQHGRLQQTS